MISNNDFPEWQYKPFWLNKEEIDQPQDVLQQFFETYSLPVCRTNLWELLTGFMNSEQADDMDRNERSDMLYFYRGLSELIEVSNLMAHKAAR